MNLEIPILRKTWTEETKRRVYPELYCSQHYYKGIYYRLDRENNRWCLYDDYQNGAVGFYNADTYRLDQCFSLYFNEFWDYLFKQNLIDNQKELPEGFNKILDKAQKRMFFQKLQQD